MLTKNNHRIAFFFAKKIPKVINTLLFLYKNAFFFQKICVFAFFVVPLHPISEEVKTLGHGAIV